MNSKDTQRATRNIAASTQSQADTWFTPGRFTLVLALLIAATFSGILLGQETFYYRDYGLFTYPVAHYQRECFWRGELPLWNPLNNCGIPFLAQWNTSALYPPSLFYLLLPLTWSLPVFNIAHLVFAGLGMYFLARRWTGNPFAASVAGMAFAFNGLTLHLLMWISNLAAVAWMPWVVLTVENAWNDSAGSATRIHPPSSILYPRLLIPAAIAGAMQMLSGAPEIILLTWLLLGTLWLGKFYSGRIPRKQIAARFLLVMILVAGLSAAQLLPFWELLSHSARSADAGRNVEWAMPFSGFANFLVPQFHSYAAAQGVFVQYDQYWISSHYVSIGATALALAGIFFTRKQRVWLLLAIMLICFWLALGTQAHLYSVIKKLPLLALMRYPIKFVVLPVFIIPLLAAYGVRWNQERVAPNNAPHPKKILTTIALALLALITVILCLAWKFPMIKDDWPVTWHHALGRAAFLILTLITLVCAGRVTRFNLQILLRLILLALLWADVYSHTPNQNPTVRPSVYEPNLARQALKLSAAAPGEPRFMETQPVMEQVRVLSLADPAEDYLSRRVALFDNCNLLDSLPKLNGFYSTYLRDSLDILSLVESADAKEMNIDGIKDFLGVGHISSSQGGNGPSLDWVPRGTSLPLITAGQRPIFAEDRAVAAALIATNFNPQETVYLSPNAQTHIKAVRTNVKIISTQIKAQRLQVEVDAAAPAMVVIAQAFYPAWHAYIDGQRAELLRANVAFQALEIPAGRHAIKVIYEDTLFTVGTIISCITLIVLAIMWLSTRRPA